MANTAGAVVLKMLQKRNPNFNERRNGRLDGRALGKLGLVEVDDRGKVTNWAPEVKTHVGKYIPNPHLRCQFGFVKANNNVDLERRGLFLRLKLLFRGLLAWGWAQWVRNAQGVPRVQCDLQVAAASKSLVLTTPFFMAATPRLCTAQLNSSVAKDPTGNDARRGRDEWFLQVCGPRGSINARQCHI